MGTKNSTSTAQVLPFTPKTISPATQHVIETLEAEIAKLRSGKARADAVILIIVEGDDTDVVYANMSHVEVIGSLHGTATILTMERQS